VQPPQIFDRTTFNNITQDQGIYAFYLSFEYITRSIQVRASANSNDLESLLGKATRGHTLSNPSDLDMNIYGHSTEFSQVYTLQATHLIKAGAAPLGMSKPDILELAAVLDKCTLLTTPLYIGMTEGQTFKTRFGQHKKKYEKYKAATPRKTLPSGRGVFQRGNQFFHRLVRRRLEFRDLIFACVPFSASELKYVPYVEKLLHAFVNPPLSDRH
jgi:hypothetical protein